MAEPGGSRKRQVTDHVAAHSQQALRGTSRGPIAGPSKLLQETGSREQVDLLAHELRRRVAALRVLAEAVTVLRERRQDVDPVLDRLVAEVDDIDALSRGILGTRGREKPEGVDVVSAVKVAARTVAAARRVAVSVETPGRPVWVRASATMLRQAIENLTDNAACYANAGPVEVSVRLPQDEGAVEILVADRGRGLAQENGSPKDGYGIGLFLVRRFLDATGGRYWAQEREGGGTVVGMRVPVVVPTSEPQGAACASVAEHLTATVTC